MTTVTSRGSLRVGYYILVAVRGYNFKLVSHPFRRIADKHACHFYDVVVIVAAEDQEQ